jgi:hypothetical protein
VADIDITELLSDPDFTDQLQLIKRTETIGDDGRTILAEAASTITVVVQAPEASILIRYPDLAEYNSKVCIWYRGELSVAGEGTYADMIVWRNRRWQAWRIVEDYMNWGAGWTMAIFVAEETVDG